MPPICALHEADQAFGIRLFGARAIESMRMEKGFLHWKADLITEYDLFETGLDRFVKLDKGEFVGRQALEARQAAGSRRRLLTMRIDTKTAGLRTRDLRYLMEIKWLGTVTSGDWGHRTGLNLAYAFVDTAFAAEGSRMEIDLCGERTVATVIPPIAIRPGDEQGSKLKPKMHCRKDDSLFRFFRKNGSSRERASAQISKPPLAGSVPADRQVRDPYKGSRLRLACPSAPFRNHLAAVWKPRWESI